MGDSEGRVLGLYILTYNTQTRYPNRNVPQTMVPFYANTDADARIEARKICEEEEKKLGRKVYFEDIEPYPHGFTTGTRT